MTAAIETNTRRTKEDALKKRWLIIECHFKKQLDRESLVLLTGMLPEEINEIIISEKNNIREAKLLSEIPAWRWESPNLVKMESILQIVCETFGEPVSHAKTKNKSAISKVAFCHLCDKMGIRVDWIMSFLDYTGPTQVSSHLRNSRAYLDVDRVYKSLFEQAEYIIRSKGLDN